MELQKRDRGLVRMARDIEMKYDLSGIERNGQKLETESERVDELIQDTKELENRYVLIEKIVEQNKMDVDDLKKNKADREEIRQLVNSINQIENNKVDKEDLENYYNKEELDEKLKDLTVGLLSFVRKITYYETSKEFEDCFKMPSYYEDGCFVDVFINGFKLEKSKYLINLEGEEYFLNLAGGLDVIGTLVEIDIVEGIKEG